MILQDIFSVKLIIGLFIGFLVGKYFEQIQEIIFQTRKAIRKAQKDQQKVFRDQIQRSPKSI